MLLPFLSIITSYFVHDQSIGISAMVMRMQLAWLFYFVLHRLKISENEILKIIIGIGFIWVILELIQQFTYPVYYFFTRGDDTYWWGIEKRAGFYRYMIDGISFALLALFYYLQKFFNTNQKRAKNSFWIISLLLGIYLFMTRQIMASVLASILIGQLLLKRIPLNRRISIFIIGILMVGSIFYFKDTIFGDLVETTSDDMNKDNIRIESYYFHLNYWDHWTCFVFGNGVPHEQSSYGKYTNYLQKEVGLHRSDIGIIGELSNYGIIYIIVFILFCFYFFRKSKEIELYLKIYFIYSLLIIPMIFPFRNFPEFLVFSVFLYLCDLSIANHSKKSISL